MNSDNNSQSAHVWAERFVRFQAADMSVEVTGNFDVSADRQEERA